MESTRRSLLWQIWIFLIFITKINANSYYITACVHSQMCHKQKQTSSIWVALIWKCCSLPGLLQKVSAVESLWTFSTCLCCTSSTPYSRAHDLGPIAQNVLMVGEEKWLGGEAFILLLLLLLILLGNLTWHMHGMFSMMELRVSGQLAYHTSKQPEFQGAKVASSSFSLHLASFHHFVYFEYKQMKM